MPKLFKQPHLKVATETGKVRAVGSDQRDVVVIVERSPRSALAARVPARRAAAAGARAKARCLCAPHTLKTLNLEQIIIMVLKRRLTCPDAILKERSGVKSFRQFLLNQGNVYLLATGVMHLKEKNKRKGKNVSERCRYQY